MTTPTVDPLAKAAMVAYCGWDPTARVVDRTVMLNGNGTRVLALPSLYVTDVSRVVITDTWGGVFPLAALLGTANLTDGYRRAAWDENGTLTWLGAYGWPEGVGNIAVTYSGGYEQVPDDLAAALASLSKRTAKGTPVTSARMGTAAFNYGAQVAGGGLLVTEQMVFDRYRMIRVA